MQFLVLTFSVTAAGLALLAWLSIRIGDEFESGYVRIALAALLSACFVGGPAAAVLWFTALVKVWYRIWFVDLPMPVLVAPVIVASIAAWLATRTGVRDRTWRATALAVCAWSGFFGVLNIVNFCSPGWCGWYGFPFPYYEWSDSVMVINGVWPNPYHPAAIPLNAFTFAAVTTLLLLVVRMARRKAAV
jgi:hypothetical protein